MERQEDRLLFTIHSIDMSEVEKREEVRKQTE